MASQKSSQPAHSSSRPQTLSAKNASQKTWPQFDAASNQTKKLQTRRYCYLQLKDLLPETIVDVYGVVKFLKLPQKTRGTDYRQVISIIDPSFCGNNKLTCVLFARDEAALPPVKIGSIVRFHRLRIGLHNGELQGVKAPGFSWLVIDGNAHGAIIQNASTTNYTFTDIDREKIKHLQEWLKEQEDLKNSENSICLEKIVLGEYFNLVCQVVSVCLIEEDVCLLLQVWDGTCPNYPIRVIETASAKDFAMNSNEELLQKAEGYIYDVCIFDDHVKKAGNLQPGIFVKLWNLHAAKYRNDNCDELSDTEMIELVLHRGSSYGRGMKVLPDSDSEVCTLRGKLQQISPKPRKRPRESPSPPLTQQQQQPPTMSSEPQPGCSRSNPSQACRPIRIQKSYEFLSQNKISSLTGHHPKVVADLSSQTPQASSSSLTNYCIIPTISVIDGHQNAQFSKILEIIDYKTPSKFRLLTRVIQYFPKIDTLPNFIELYCPQCHYIVGSNNAKYKNYFLPNSFAKGPACPDCQASKIVVPYLQYIFKLKLLIGDSSGYMIVNLWKEEAVKFFDGLTPQTVINDKDAYNRLLDFLHLMCPTEKVLSQRPIMECCIKSYFNRETSLVCYQLFDTVLVT